MRFRVKNNINYGNIIKDDIKISYRNNKIKDNNLKKEKVINILDNLNFRNNQNYIVSKKLASKLLNKNSINLLYKLFLPLSGLVFIGFFVRYGFYSLFFLFLLFIILFKRFLFIRKKYLFHFVKENYHNGFFIITADKK